MDTDAETIRATILDLLRQRDEGKTICPSDAARALDARGFRSLMGEVRAAAQELVSEGRIEVTQRAEVVDLATVKGPVRLRLRS